MDDTVDKATSHDNKRREFLRGSALLGAGATLVAGTPALAATETEAQPVVETEQAKKPKGYRLTKHIEAYYRSAAS